MTRIPRSFFLPVLAFALGATLSTPADTRAQWSFRSKVVTKQDPRFLSAFREVIREARKSTIAVVADGDEVALGTVVDADGLVLTKASELRGEVRCLVRGRAVPARILASHEAYDLALLQVEARGLTPVNWAPSRTAVTGGWLASVGTEEVPVAVGVLSVPSRKVTDWRLAPNVNPAGGFLGIATNDGDEGVEIIQVVPGTAAEKARLQVGDVLLTIRGKKVDKPEAVFLALRGTRPGDRIEITVRRRGEDLDFVATLGKRPARTRSEIQNNLGSELSVRRTGFPSILQHDTVIKPAHCGGPLVGLDGKAVGINIARAGRTESYAIPSEDVMTILAEFRKSAKTSSD